MTISVTFTVDRYEWVFGLSGLVEGLTGVYFHPVPHLVGVANVIN